MSNNCLCLLDQEEVFNILFVKKSKEDHSHLVYCQNCALKASPSLEEHAVLYQYRMEDLIEVYDSFLPFQVSWLTFHRLWCVPL